MHFWWRFIHFSYTFSEPHSSNSVSDLLAILESFSTQMLRSPCGQLVPRGLESHRTFNEYDTHHFSHQFNYLHLLPVWTVTILPYHRHAFILRFIIFVLECSRYNDLRTIYIPNYYRRRPNMFKLVELFKSESKKTQINLSLYVFKAFKVREQFVFG